MAFGLKIAAKGWFREDGFKTLSCFKTLVEKITATKSNLIALLLEY